MNPTPADSSGNASVRTGDAEWYDQHYSTRDTVEARGQPSEVALFRHLGPWYFFAIPHLRAALSRKGRFLDLGCGSGRMSGYLVREGLIPAENVFGLDQSRVAVERATRTVPGGHFQTGDIHNLSYPASFFDVVLLMEVIEHLEQPLDALKQIWTVMTPGGYLYISHPNYVNPAWLAVRVLSEKLNRPNWIVLQPIDRIYTVWGIKRFAAHAGFQFKAGIGSSYGPPLLDRLERPWMARMLNKMGLWWLSFHPILVFQKPLEVS